MNNTPLISVIVPVYNVEKYLRKCVDSIVNQTYKNLEIILVDDGSPDNCGKICDEFAEMDNRVMVIHKENGGLSSARNAGLDIATGEYITFVDSDDYIENDTYEKVVVAINKFDSDLIFFREKSVDESGKTIYINGDTPSGEIFEIFAVFYKLLICFIIRLGSNDFFIHFICLLNELFYCIATICTNINKGFILIEFQNIFINFRFRSFNFF